MSENPKKKITNWERIASYIGIFLGYFSYGVIKGIQTFPGEMEVVVFVSLFILVGEALVFSIIFYFEELLLRRSPWKGVNAFVNGVVVTFAAFDVGLALLNHKSPLLI